MPYRSSFRRFGSRSSYGRNRRGRKTSYTRPDAGPGQRGHLLAIGDATAQSSLALVQDSVMKAGTLASLLNRGNVPTTAEDAQIVTGYQDWRILNTQADAFTGYFLEYLLQPGETDSTTGLADGNFLLKKFLQKQLLGITTFMIPGHWAKIVRVPWSKASVMTVAGYTYNWKMYPDTAAAVNTVYVRHLGSKLVWDRIV